VVSSATLAAPGYPRNLLSSHPRTALGVSRDGRRLVIAVIDGRAPGRDGMSAREVGRWLRDVGCHDGIMLDGGGSSVLVVKGRGVVSHTPTGGERTVGIHFGVRLRAPSGA
jgi:exopolysaccharide biosynthesis protein